MLGSPSTTPKHAAAPPQINLPSNGHWTMAPSATTIPTLPALRIQPHYQNHLAASTTTLIAECETPCAVRRCSHYAKMHGYCLAHHRSIVQLHVPSTPTTSEETRPSIGDTSSGYESALGSPLADSSKKLKLKNRNRKCRTESCVSYARSGGFCTRHGGGRKCQADGCGTASQTGGFCRLHGGGSRCRIAQCDQFARIRGLCLHHNRVAPDDCGSFSSSHEDRS
ncbi:hypothetical protein H310_03881 [Aphanomyces invadans]|uniref:WRKY19-like zinc finger domain-containing protein n=1 Tax=Aphanomyces invadans TaxID=157072 RepID=A0A024UFR6_9STRA|nr:hypothetical protein H310_03881 [Aphanomyces invadans]ETW04732.1 hypothetical protein H310_03881 [Aphanomyces invadans]|eukprot:XP_008866170.1 hypothetical protein H310_03881 [Aphanomyces invadans]